MSHPVDQDVRFATLADASQLAALHAAAFPLGHAWTRGALEDLLRLDTTLALAMDADGPPASFILVQCAEDQAEILTLATHPSRQRQGLAARLLAHCLNQLRQRGIETWFLEVAEDNPGAISFYERFGFVRTGKRPRYYKRLEGSPVSAILMSMPVGGQAIR